MPITRPEPHPPLPGAGLGSAMARLRHRWGWFVALGMLAALLGTAALGLVVLSTVAAVYVVALLMVLKGGSEIAVGLGSRGWGREILLILAGLAYIVAGAFALAQPGPAAAALTLMLGVALLAAGAVRVYVGTHMHAHARTMVVASGLATAVIGLLVVAGWPGNTPYILGTLLGLDLLLTGVLWIGFGLRLRSHA